MDVTRPPRWSAPWLAAAASAAWLAGAAWAAEPPGLVRKDGLKAVVAADGFDHPLYLCAAPGSNRIFVVEQPGRIRWIENGRPSRKVFLDMRALVSYGGERGLLGLAFHPGYATNGFLYVNYTDRNGDTQVVRYTARADRDSVAARSAKRILSVVQPFANQPWRHRRCHRAE